MSFWLKPTEDSDIYVNLDKCLYLEIDKSSDDYFVIAYFGGGVKAYLSTFDSKEKAHKFIKEILCAGKDV